MLSVQECATILTEKFPEAIELVTAEVGDSFIRVAPEHLLAICEELKGNTSLQFHTLQVITGTDYPEKEIIEVSYILTSFYQNHDLMIKVDLQRGQPQVASVCSIWKAADWQERECYDMLGVEFQNHPDLRRILCGEDWEGFPLRKDYEPAETYHGMVINPEHKMNNDDREFADRQKQIEREAKAAAKAEAEKEGAQS